MSILNNAPVSVSTIGKQLVIIYLLIVNLHTLERIFFMFRSASTDLEADRNIARFKNLFQSKFTIKFDSWSREQYI